MIAITTAAKPMAQRTSFLCPASEREVRRSELLDLRSGFIGSGLRRLGSDGHSTEARNISRIDPNTGLLRPAANRQRPVAGTSPQYVAWATASSIVGAVLCMVEA